MCQHVVRIRSQLGIQSTSELIHQGVCLGGRNIIGRPGRSGSNHEAGGDHLVVRDAGMLGPEPLGRRLAADSRVLGRAGVDQDPNDIPERPLLARIDERGPAAGRRVDQTPGAQ